MISLLASVLLAAITANDAPALLAENATASEIIAACRSLVPERAVVSGRIIYTRRKSIVTGKRAVDRDYRYRLSRIGKTTTLMMGPVDGGELEVVTPPASGDMAIEGTGVNWSDLTLDYLWWDDVRFDPEQKEETKTLFKCARLLLTKGDRVIRLWVTYKHGAPIEAEELRGGKTVRKLWASSIKSFSGRWMASRLEVQDMETKRRTRITVEALD